MLHPFGAKACSYFTIGNIVQKLPLFVPGAGYTTPTFRFSILDTILLLLIFVSSKNNSKQVATTLFLFGFSSLCIYREMLLLLSSSLSLSSSWVFYWSFLFCFVFLDTTTTTTLVSIEHRESNRAEQFPQHY